MSKKKKNKKPINTLLNYLSNKFNFTVNDKDIYTTSLTHESYCYEYDIDINSSYERLEFLGDSVISLVIAKHLYNNYPDTAVGDISKCKSRIVSANILIELAKKIDIGKYVLLGRGEEAAGGRTRNSILADSFESLIGALYLDAGFEPAERMIISLYDDMIDKSMVSDFDHKSILQEKIQNKYKDLPNYKTLKESGPSHKKVFDVAVYYKGKLLGKGKGRSKKEAEQLAAEKALKKFGG